MTLAAATLLISGVTLLVGHGLRHRSAPFREVIFRVGLCLVGLWPLLVAGGIVRQSMRGDHAAPLLSLQIVPEPVAENLTDAEEPVAVQAADLALVEPSSGPFLLSPSTPIPQPPVHAATPSVAEQVAETEFDSSQIALPAAKPQTVFDPVPVSALPSDTLTSKPKTDAVTLVPAPRQPVWHPLPSVPSTLAVSFVAAWQWLCGVWGIGTIIAGLTLARDLLRVRRMRRQLQPCVDDVFSATLDQAMRATGLHRRPDVFLSPQIGSPCTSGVRQPILILPQTMLDQGEHDPATLLGVFTHECAHIVRRDVAWSLLARVIQSVYWWEPGLRRVVRQLSHVREEICDNFVLSSSVDARAYAKVLVDFAEGPLFRPLVGVIGMVGTDNPLAERVERLLQEAPDIATGVKWRSKWGVAVIVLLVCGMVGVVAACSEISKSLSQVLLSEAPQPVAGVASTDSRTVPIWSGESEVRPAEPAPWDDVSVDTPLAGAAYREFGTPTETGSGVSSDARNYSPFGQPTEAGSGTSNFAQPLLSDDSEAKTPPGIMPPDNSVPQSPEDGFGPTPYHPSSPPPSAPRYRPVTRTVIVDGRPTTVTHMVPFNNPLESSSEAIPGLPGDPLAPPADKIVNPTPKLREITLTLSSDPAFLPGEKVTLVAMLPEGEKRLPKRIVFEGLTVGGIPPKEADRLREEAALQIPDLLPAPSPPVEAPIGEVAAPDSPAPTAAPLVGEAAAPAAEAVAAANTAAADLAATTPATVEVTLSGPATILDALASLQARGATATVTKAVTPTPETESSSPLDRKGFMRGKSSFQIEVEALADDKGQFRAISCWGRELASTNPDKGLSELTALLTRFKAECLQVAGEGKAVPPVVMSPETRPRPSPYQHPSAESLMLSVGVQVFDDMRYGDVQSIFKICSDLKLLPLVMNNQENCSNCPTPLRVFAPVELTMVYDKQGKPVGQHAVLVVEKAGASGVQVITESQIDSLLSAFVNRHSNRQSALILNDDPDLPLEALLTFIVRANRAGISVIQRSQLEELRLRENDFLVPLLNDAPLERVDAKTVQPFREVSEGVVPPEDGFYRGTQLVPTPRSHTDPNPDPLLKEPGVREI